MDYSKKINHLKTSIQILLLCCVCQKTLAQNWLPKIITYDIWDRMRADFSLPDNYRNVPAVQAQLKWYKKHPEHLNKIIKNSEPYLEYIVTQVEEKGLPGEIALLPFIESNFNPFAYSHAGATGIWQMMPGTASGYGVTINWWYDGRRDIIESTKTALNYITYLGDYFNQNWLNAIAAYDSGEGKVRKAVNRQKSKKISDFWTLRLPNETKSYLPKLIALKEIIQNPEKYKITLPAMENNTTFSTFNIPKQVDLNQVADMAGIDINTLRLYNPGYRRMATTPKTAATILIPVEKTEIFKHRLNNINIAADLTPQLKKHTVVSGDSISEIASKYESTIEIIKTANKLESDTIRVKQILIIPSATTLTNTKNNDYYKVSSKISQDRIPGPQIIVHKVKAGDTVATIAAKYNVTLGQIEFWNSINARKKLKNDDEIILWTKKSNAKSPVKSGSYQALLGDTLGAIAHKYHQTIEQLKEKNNLKTDVIKANQILKV